MAYSDAMPLSGRQRKGTVPAPPAGPMGSVISESIQATVPIDRAMVSADSHSTGGWQGRVPVVVALQTPSGIARAMRVPDPADPRKLDTSALPVAGVMVARCRAASRLIPAIVMPVRARGDIALILTVSFRNGRGQEGEDRDAGRDGGGFATITGVGGGRGEARHGHRRSDDKRDECAVHELSFPVSWMPSPRVRHG